MARPPAHEPAAAYRYWAMIAVAIAAMPSPRPVSPRPSVVVADTQTVAPRAADNACR